MKEDFLHYVWKYQEFDSKNLLLVDGRSLVILQKGQHNHDAGPDFSESRIKIGEIEWAGNVEIHLKSSDWLLHNHQADSAYHNVVLHVVWQHDSPILNTDGQEIPTLELKGRVSNTLIGKYQKLLSAKKSIACEAELSQVDGLKKMAMLDSALARRKERKANEVLDILNENKGDWEQTAYQVLVRNFGFKLNNEVFERFARSLPISFLQKQSHEPQMVEALIFGQAGFLDVPLDTYAEELKTHYSYFAQKFNLQSSKMLRSQWKFMRTRPGNFPTVRLAQLSAFLLKTKNLLSHFLNYSDYKSLSTSFQITPSAYWKSHYDFGKKQDRGLNKMGDLSAQNLLINTVVPILTAYGKYTAEQSYDDKAMRLLETIPAEENRITKLWKKHDVEVKNMQDSQGAIEQYNEYCTKLKCMECAIGVGILRK